MIIISNISPLDEKVKKILFLIPLFFVAIFSFPLLAYGAVMELTVTVSNIQIPERSAMVPVAIDTEYRFSSGRIVVVDDSTGSIVSPFLSNCSDATQIANTYSRTISFPYDATHQYSVHIDAIVNSQGSEPICKTNCTDTAGGSGWYYISGLQRYSGGSWVSASCPFNPCTQTSTGWRGYLAVPPESVFTVGSCKYWRSASIFDITQS